MKSGWATVAALAIVIPASAASAGAWNEPKGHGQIILKYERMRAAQAYDEAGHVTDMPNRLDRSLSGLLEYGLTERLTARFKGEWQSGEDMFADFEGRGPLEVGVAWQAYRDDRHALSLYAGVASAGEGRNAGYAPPGAGERDWEVRLLAGRSVGGDGWRWAPNGAFVEVQAARLWRDGLPNEVRADVTAGVHLGQNWMALAQAFAGRTDDDRARWLSTETSLVRHLGRWSLQAGWRRTAAGRNVPLAQGAVLAAWRRF